MAPANTPWMSERPLSGQLLNTFIPTLWEPSKKSPTTRAAGTDGCYGRKLACVVSRWGVSYSMSLCNYPLWSRVQMRSWEPQISNTGTDLISRLSVRLRPWARNRRDFQAVSVWLRCWVFPFQAVTAGGSGLCPFALWLSIPFLRPLCCFSASRSWL